MSVLASAYDRLGETRLEFGCCDTTFRVHPSGVRAASGAAAARRTAAELEATLDAFDPESAVSRLNDRGSVRNPHVARIVRRGLEYAGRTGGVFDIRQGRLEHDLKAYLRGDREVPPESFDTGSVTVDG